MEGDGKGGGRPFHRRNFNKKELMFKSPEVGLYTITFSYGQTKDVAPFVK